MEVYNQKKATGQNAVISTWLVLVLTESRLPSLYYLINNPVYG